MTRHAAFAFNVLFDQRYPPPQFRDVHFIGHGVIMLPCYLHGKASFNASSAVNSNFWC
jgi:hypothetical protein